MTRIGRRSFLGNAFAAGASTIIPKVGLGVGIEQPLVFEEGVFAGRGSANVKDRVSRQPGGIGLVDAGPSEWPRLGYMSEPSLVATPSGKVFIFYRIGNGHQSMPGVTSPLVFRAYDRETNRWGGLNTVASKKGYDTRNQIAGVTQTGRLWVAYFQVEYSAPGIMKNWSTNYKYSDDEGENWSSEARLDLYVDYPAPSQTIIPFGKLTGFSNGDLMITLYRLRTIVALRSTDNGESWGIPYSLGALPHRNPGMTTIFTSPDWAHDNITEPTVIKISDERLVAVCRAIPSGVVTDGTARLQFLGRGWAPSNRYEVGMCIVNLSHQLYRCTARGISSEVPPSHTIGGAMDGSAAWEYIGKATTWRSDSSASLGSYLKTSSNLVYRVDSAGVTGTAEPSYQKYRGNETQMAFIRSSDAGFTWSSVRYVTWTDVTWQSTTSPPRGICDGEAVDIAWYSRSPEWSLYYVRMDADSFFGNPAGAFSGTDGEPRKKVTRAYLDATANSYSWRVDVGYVDIEYLPWTGSHVMMAWYDKPDPITVGKTSLFFNLVRR